MRVLETVWAGPERGPLEGRTRLMIVPGRPFAAVGALVTNFHLPRSTLLALVMAFAGVDETRAALPHRGRRALPLLQLRRCDAAPMSTPFRVTATDGGARAGVLETAHGPVRDAGVHAGRDEGEREGDAARRSCAALGAQIVLGNTYHLHFRPGEERIAELGGLHRFSGWDGPILTDSGGFQVFSLRHTAARIDDEGVRFRSVYDGSEHHFTPELAMRVQRLLGSDIAMAFDECPPAGVDRGRVEAAVRRTGLWAQRSRAQPRAEGQLGFGIVQGGTDLDLRRRSAEEIVAIGFDGYAVGGLSVGEERGPMLETLAATAALLPAGPAALPDGGRRPGRA